MIKFVCTRPAVRWRSDRCWLLVAICASFSLSAQEPGQSTKPMDNGQMDQSHMDHSREDMSGMKGMPGMDGRDGMNSAGHLLMSETSGTALQPSAWPMPMLMNQVGDWHLMWMGQAFVVDTQQSGSLRAGDKLYSTNWGMLGAVHQLGGGSVMLRGMLSLEPATVTNRSYPLLFQTGETAFGKPIVDGQHPHDLFMELSVQYAHSLGENATWNVYYAPVGEPALGPVAYPHRASAMELPQAALGHHWQDSSHIANNVLTAGVGYEKVRVEASGFYGREPNENRWNIDYGRLNSWSTRVSVFPTKNWSAQASVGRLRDPEQTHPGDVVRTTASIHYVRPAMKTNWWATSFIWGQDHKVADSLTVNAVLAETVIPIRRKNFITGRYEWSQRDELFENDHALGELLQARTGQSAFKVNAWTVGYTRDVATMKTLQSGLGFNVTTYAMDDILKPYYGSHPWGINIFARFRLKSAD
ncbi:MAG: hypothetical protein ACJ74Y_08495 [Bryobacteraceae bacterium]